MPRAEPAHLSVRRHHNPSPCPVADVGAVTELGGPEGGWGPPWEPPHPEPPENLVTRGAPWYAILTGHLSEMGNG
eukprot:3743861-Prymnesium_polylepis.1